jgi:hypothetical protein
MSLSYSAAVIKEHASMIEQSIDDLKSALANRGAVPDHSTYSFLVGKIEGLRLALELCDDAVKKVNEN